MRDERRWSHLSFAREALLLGAAFWVLSRSVLYVLSVDDIRRHHVESGWFIFAASIVAAALLKQRVAETGSQVSNHKMAGASTIAIFIGASVALYWPSLRLGFLSDDFVLYALASRGALLDPSLEFTRPLPLAVWSLVNALVPAEIAPAILHCINVILHGVNAWLVMGLAHLLTADPQRARLAAAIFVATPLVEPVVWVSGVFDVLLLTVCLTAVRLLVLNATWRTPALIGMAIAAVLTKETGVILGLLLSTVILVRRDACTRENVIAIALVLAVGTIYVLLRFSFGLPSSHTELLSGYQVKELLVRPFATLALPIHANLLLSARTVAALWVAGLVAVIWINARRWTGVTPDFHVTVGLSCWIVFSVAPLLATFFVGGDLQGARYVYVGYAAWAVILSTLILRPTGAAQSWVRVALSAAVVLASMGILRMHLSPWLAAAETRDAVLQSYASFRNDCPPSSVHELPDNVSGAYVFRNGFEQAAAGPDLPGGHDDNQDACRLLWRDMAFVRTR